MEIESREMREPHRRPSPPLSASKPKSEKVRSRVPLERSSLRSFPGLLTGGSRRALSSSSRFLRDLRLELRVEFDGGGRAPMQSEGMSSF